MAGALLAGVAVAVAVGMPAASWLSSIIGPTTQLVMSHILGMLVGALGIEFIPTGILELLGSRGL